MIILTKEKDGVVIAKMKLAEEMIEDEQWKIIQNKLKQLVKIGENNE